MVEADFREIDKKTLRTIRRSRHSKCSFFHVNKIQLGLSFPNASSSKSRSPVSAGGLAAGPAPFGLELNMRKTIVCGQKQVPAASPLAATTRLHLEEGTKVLGVPIRSPLYASAVEAHLGKFGAKFAHTYSAVGGLAETQSEHVLMRQFLGPEKEQ